MAKQMEHELKERRLAAHSQHTDIAPESVKEISAALTAVPADHMKLAFVFDRVFLQYSIRSEPSLCGDAVESRVQPTVKHCALKDWFQMDLRRRRTVWP